jgi:transcriptional antiterminator NusG
MSDQNLLPDAIPAAIPAETPASFAPASNKRWYVVHAYSGMEKAVERNLREQELAGSA